MANIKVPLCFESKFGYDITLYTGESDFDSSFIVSKGTDNRIFMDISLSFLKNIDSKEDRKSVV